jgi:hypothetical protein
VHVFAGFDFVDADLDRSDFAAHGYAKGGPMELLHGEAGVGCEGMTGGTRGEGHPLGEAGAGPG